MNSEKLRNPSTDKTSYKAMTEQLFNQYAAGGKLAGLRLKLIYWRKVALWRSAVFLGFALKRALDILGGLAGLILFSPIFLAVILAIKIEDRGPVFFQQTRVGKDGTTFQMYKFRSMVLNADKMKDELLDQDESEGATFKIKKDPRITKVGRIIRKLSIDEFPQFFNVVKGDMSLVGPRPAVPREVEVYEVEHRRRLAVKPGITCLWQIGGRSDLDFEQQVALDVQYIHSQTFRQDVLILLKTVPAVISGKGAY